MDLNTAALHPFIRQALIEDVGDGDHTSLSTIPQGQQGRAKLLIKDTGILAGVLVALEIFKIVDPALTIEVHIHDGEPVSPGDIAFYVDGSVHSILIAERLVLNTMQRMSGIASTTNKVVKLLEGTKTKVLDTRKTTPGMRYLEKLAVKIGGGVNHRLGLYDMILIKDNHVAVAGSVGEATRRAVAAGIANVIVEVDRIDQIEEALDAGATHILLDNMMPTTLRESVALIGSRAVTEASGGVRLDTIRTIAETGVTYVSVGRLTQSAPAVDIGLDFALV